MKIVYNVRLYDDLTASMTIMIFKIKEPIYAIDFYDDLTS